MLSTSLLEWYIATDDQGVEGGLFFENWNAIFDPKHVRPVEDHGQVLAALQNRNRPCS